MTLLALSKKMYQTPELTLFAKAPIAMQMTKSEYTASASHVQSVKHDHPSADDRIDRGLIEQIAHGRDPKAMETFYERYRSRLVPFLHRLTHDDHTIEDVYNEVMLKLWDCAHQYRGQSKVSTWVFTIAYRACLRVVKRQSKIYSLFDTQVEPDEFSSNDSNHDEQQAIRKAVDALPGKDRIAIELCYFQGYTLEEIGEIVDAPLNTVKTRMHRARKKIRAALEKHHPTSDWSNWL